MLTSVSNSSAGDISKRLISARIDFISANLKSIDTSKGTKNIETVFQTIKNMNILMPYPKNNFNMMKNPSEVGMDIFSIFFVFILEKLDSMNTHVVDIEKVQNTIKDIYAGLESIETFLEDIYSSIKLYQYPYEINDFKKFEKIIQDFSGNKNFHLGNDNFFGMKYFKSSTLEVIINEVEENSASIIDITDIVTNHSNSQPISHKPMSNVR